MKRSSLTLIIGALLVVIFAFWLCAFQVRTTEVAVVTTFGKPTRPIDKPGIYGKWPPPIQTVHKFDNRIQSSEFEYKIREDLTADQNPLLTSIYVGWQISDPGLFLRKFPGGISAAEQQLANLLSTAKSAVIGKHPLSDFVSASGEGSKFPAIENEILAAVQAQLQGNEYGIKINFLGFKKIGLPEDTTQKVFERMVAERAKIASATQNEGEAKAKIIRSDADLQAAKTLAAAQGQASLIQGQGVAEATKYLDAFQQNPELASFLFRLDALEASLKGSTLIFDQQTPPFDLFKSSTLNPANKK